MINQCHLCKMKWGKVTPLPCLHALAPGFVMTSLWLLVCTGEECSQSQSSLSVFPTTGLPCGAIFFSLESLRGTSNIPASDSNSFPCVTCQFCEPGRAQSLPHALLLSDASALLSGAHTKAGTWSRTHGGCYLLLPPVSALLTLIHSPGPPT